MHHEIVKDIGYDIEKNETMEERMRELLLRTQELMKKNSEKEAGR